MFFGGYEREDFVCCDGFVGWGVIGYDYVEFVCDVEFDCGIDVVGGYDIV